MGGKADRGLLRVQLRWLAYRLNDVAVPNVWFHGPSSIVPDGRAAAEAYTATFHSQSFSRPMTKDEHRSYLDSLLTQESAIAKRLSETKPDK